MYQSFLDGIKKYGTGSVNPKAFNRIINDWGQDLWVKHNLRRGIEITQEMQDKLSALRVITDGLFPYYTSIDLSLGKPLLPIACNERVIYYVDKWGVGHTSVVPDTDSYFKYPLDYQMILSDNVEIIYPPYLRLLNVAFKIEYVNNICKFTGVSEWLDANINKSDNKTVKSKNPYRKATDDRLYYEIMGDHIILETGTESKGHSMRLDYIRHPRRIFFNIINNGPDEEQKGVPDFTGGTSGSVNCELPGDLRQEIVDIAVRTFIERVQDPRYQTYINELNIKRNG